MCVRNGARCTAGSTRHGRPGRLDGVCYPCRVCPRDVAPASSHLPCLFPSMTHISHHHTIGISSWCSPASPHASHSHDLYHSPTCYTHVSSSASASTFITIQTTLPSFGGIVAAVVCRVREAALRAHPCPPWAFRSAESPMPRPYTSRTCHVSALRTRTSIGSGSPRTRRSALHSPHVGCLDGYCPCERVCDAGNRCAHVTRWPCRCVITSGRVQAVAQTLELRSSVLGVGSGITTRNC